MAHDEQPPIALGSEETKAVVKEALTEWLDGKFAQFGRWSFYGIAAAGLAALVYFILVHNGWRQQ